MKTETLTKDRYPLKVKGGGTQSTNEKPSFAKEKGHLFSNKVKEEDWVVMPPDVWIW